MSNNRITLRSVRPEDENELRRLAELDSADPLAGSPLIAEVDGQAVAAYSPEEGRAIADPFHHTAAAVELLETRARLITGSGGRFSSGRPTVPHTAPARRRTFFA